MKEADMERIYIDREMLELDRECVERKIEDRAG